MRCPRCNFEGEPVQGRCPRCGYGPLKVSGNSFYTVSQYSLPSKPTPVHKLKHGDTLRQGRYRLIEPLILPENQQEQGSAWLANDVQSPQIRVVVRELIPPAGSAADKEKMVHAAAQSLSDLGQHPGFPRVIDVFNEQGNNYIVLQYIEGESLAATLRRQGGALPERIVAQYGRQLSDLLTVLSRQQPPHVHGAINPETIIVGPDGKRVFLIYVPPFPPKELPSSKALSGYLAPEQVRGVVEPTSDLYALAATLHHAVTGYDPRERMAFFHPPARRLNPAVTPRMEAILAQELRLSPSQRYARPADMEKDLVALIASYPPESELPGTFASESPRSFTIEEMRRKSRSRSSREAAIFATVSIFVLVGFLLVLLRPNLGFGATNNNRGPNVTATSFAQQQAVNAELALEMRTYLKKGIGISDGRFVFDTFAGRNDVDLKKKAAMSIQKGDVSSAVNDLTQATSADPTDGEALIYNEDIHILQSGAQFVTIVLGLPIDNSAADFNIDRNDMESAFLTQHEINRGNELPGGLQLRILIDSSGASNDDVGTVAQFIANRVAKVGNLDHIIAVVGWPFSSQTINARDIIAAVHVPLISQTASSVKLSGSSPYFFRVNPPDDQQGNTLGTVAVQKLNAKTILVMRDPTDPYSVSLADAFAQRVRALGETPLNNQKDYFTEATTSVAAYQQVVNDAMANRANLIFLAGLDVDAIRLAHALGNASRADPYNLYLANLKILGGDAVDTGLILGQGTGPEQGIATSFPQDMQRLIFTAFGHPDEWKFLKLQSKQPQFFANWVSTYQSSAVKANNAPDPGNDAILTYDAFEVIIKAATLVHGNLTGQAIRNALASLGTGKIPAYTGISGRIQFNSQGNPIDKAVVVLDVENNGNGNMITLIQIAGMFA